VDGLIRRKVRRRDVLGCGTHTVFVSFKKKEQSDRFLGGEGKGTREAGSKANAKAYNTRIAPQATMQLQRCWSCHRPSWRRAYRL